MHCNTHSIVEFWQIDTDNDGVINFEEFLTMMTTNKVFPKTTSPDDELGELRDAFKVGIVMGGVARGWFLEEGLLGEGLLGEGL